MPNWDLMKGMHNCPEFQMLGDFAALLDPQNHVVYVVFKCVI